jgi:hypothetical protein
MNPFLPEADSTPSQEAACKGWDDVFLSLDPNDHQYAANVCNTTCQIRDWCEKQLRSALKDSAYGLGVHGTWNGKLYKNGRRVMGRASVGTCPQCGAEDGRTCRSTNGQPLGTPHRARSEGGLPECPICSTTFSPSRVNMRYCSPDCAKEGNRRNRRATYMRQPMKACEGCLAPTRGTWCTTCTAKKGHAVMAARKNLEWGYAS